MHLFVLTYLFHDSLYIKRQTISGRDIHSLNLLVLISEWDQEIPQSHTHFSQHCEEEPQGVYSNKT